MKQIKYFIKYVELKTKVASVLPFLVALLFYLNTYGKTYGVKPLNFVLFFLSMLLFDMCTTAINNYMGIIREKDISDYDASIVKDMEEFNYTLKTNRNIIIILLVISSLLGISLVLLSNIGVLLLGMLSFAIGILYTYGPKPIAYTPFGEVFAGGAMGIILPVIVIFTQFNHLPFELNPLLIVVFFPLAFTIGAILLANNICDIEKDVNNKRYTLAYYIKERGGVIALYLANLGAIMFIVISVILGYLSSHYLGLILTIIPLSINVKKFSIKCSKAESFVYIVNNFILFSVTYIIFLLFFK